MRFAEDGEVIFDPGEKLVVSSSAYSVVEVSQPSEAVMVCS